MGRLAAPLCLAACFLVSFDAAAQPFTELATTLQGAFDGSVAWGDYDGDGDLDIVISGDSGFAPVCTIYRNDGGGVFSPAAGLTGVLDSSVAWGDYDNDGDLDILLTGLAWVSAVASKPVALIFRNDGGDSFTEIAAGLTGVLESSVAWGDYDSDGDLDILLTGDTSRWYGVGASVVYRNDGAGVFTDIQAGLTPVCRPSVAWGDYDTDGDLDILLTGRSGASIVSKVYRNDGGGIFTDIAAGLMGVFAGSVAWGDADNDGDLDILLTGRNGSIPVTKIYRNDSNHEFVEIAAPLLGVQDSSVAWGDYDNDGDLDILLAGDEDGSSGHPPKIYRNEGNDELVLVATGMRVVNRASLAWGDADNDGDLDVLLSGSSANVISRIYRNDCPVPNTAPDAPTGLTTPLGTGDVTLGWTAATDAQTPSSGLTYDLQVWTASGATGAAGRTSPESTPGHRLPRAGMVHGTTATRASLPPGTYHWTVQAVDTAFAGSPFAAESTFTICSVSLSPPSTAMGVPGGSGAVTVTTGAGCPWTAVSHEAWITITSGASGTGVGTVGYTVAANTGPARSGTVTIGGQTFTVDQASWCQYSINPTRTSVGAGGGTGTVSVTTAAVCPWTSTSDAVWITVTSGASGTGDGSTGYSVTANRGPARSGALTIAGATFTVDQDAATFNDTGVSLQGVSNASVAWGDHDNDGDLDILLTGNSSGAVARIYRNDGGGVFADLAAGLTGVHSGSAAWGDVDNDGDLDILLTGQDASWVRVAKVYRNDGAGVFTEIPAGLAGVSKSSVAWGDYDDDGDLDILLAGETSAEVVAKVYRNDGGGAFADIGAALTGVYLCAVAWGDADEDGDLDILLTGSTWYGPVAKVYRNDGRGGFTDIGATLQGVYCSSVAWGDVDDDGDLDILLAGTTGSAAVSRIYRNQGAGVFTEIAAGLIGVYLGAAAWGDHDNDGDLDVFLAGSTGGGSVSKVYRNDGGGVLVDVAAGLTAVDSASAAWGDFDNDGDLDLLLAGWAGSGAIARLYRNESPVANTAPAAPAGLDATPGTGQVTLSWTAASDSQTPSAGLTYNLRVAAAPGGVDILSPMASTATGWRRVPQPGNAGHSTTATVGSLPVGTYYWSVQAVDSAFAGSPFAPEASFVIHPGQPLTVVKTGNGSGTVTSIPAGISCGAICSAPFAHGSSVTLDARASTDSTFTGWSGACSGTGGCTITMDQARSVTASFTLKTYTLTVSRTGAGTGSVASQPGGISCGDTCTAIFDAGTLVVLTATPDTGTTFGGWSGACTGTTACQVRLDQALAVVARFVPTRNGDLNADGEVDVSDVFYLINHLFAGGPDPIGPGDVTGDSEVNVQDVFHLINHLFAGGPAPV